MIMRWTYSHLHIILSWCLGAPLPKTNMPSVFIVWHLVKIWYLCLFIYIFQICGLFCRAYFRANLEYVNAKAYGGHIGACPPCSVRCWGNLWKHAHNHMFSSVHRIGHLDCSLYGSNGWFSSNPFHPSFINIYSTSTNTRSHMLEIFRHTIQWYSSVSVLIHRFFRRGRSYAEPSSFVDDQGIMVLMSITGHRSFFHTPRPPRSSRTMNRLWNATMNHMVMNVRGNMYSKKRANEVWPRGSSSTTFIPKAFCGAVISIRHSC